MKKIVAYAKLLRIPGVAALAIIPVFGALTVGITDLPNLLILSFIGACIGICGFLLNDYVDVDLDKLVKELHGKPLAGGHIDKIHGLSISIFCIIFCYFLISLLFNGKVIDNYRFSALLCITIAAILGSFYNIYGKRFFGSDIILALGVALVFLFGALSFGQPNLITWIVFVLIFNNILHMNAIEGGIKDADHDFMMDTKNFALQTGVKVIKDKLVIPTHFKIFSMGIRFTSVILLFIPFIYFKYPFYNLQIILLVFLTILMLFLSCKLITMKMFDRGKIRKSIGMQSFLRYSLVPIMLMSIIDIWWYSILLIIIPLMWYMAFTPLVGERLFKPRM